MTFAELTRMIENVVNDLSPQTAARCDTRAMVAAFGKCGIASVADLREVLQTCEAQVQMMLDQLEVPLIFLAKLKSRVTHTPQAVVHCLSMKIWNSREFKGVRREVYQVLAQSGACYPSSRGDGVRYEGKTLCVQAFYRDADDARKAEGAISVAISSRVDKFRGKLCLVDNRVDQVDATSASESTILATDYCPDADEERSPQETLSDGAVSAATDQLVQHQSVERCISRFYVKAHLIDKNKLREYPLSLLNKDPNNFLALSPTSHDMFDGRNVPGGEAFAVRYESVHDDQPPRVALRVIPVDEETTQYLASNLRGEFLSTRDPPVGFIVHVNVSDPELFRVCITWKYNKTVKSWADRSIGPPGAVRVDGYNFELIAIRVGGTHDLPEE